MSYEIELRKAGFGRYMFKIDDSDLMKKEHKHRGRVYRIQADLKKGTVEVYNTVNGIYVLSKHSIELEEFINAKCDLDYLMKRTVEKKC